MKEQEIFDFSVLKKEYTKELAKLNKLRTNYVNSFPINQINDLKLDEYIVGKASKKSFCYRIETQLQDLGNMKGSTSAKFGIYFGKKGDDKELKYRFTEKYGTEKDEAFRNVKSEITNLLIAGKEEGSEEIIRNKVAPLFKYKLLGTYFPDTYLNVYSKRHLDYFIGELGINCKAKSILGKQVKILDFKNSNPISKDWTNQEFAKFLYEKIGRPPKEDSDQEKIQILPSLDKVKLRLIDLDVEDHESKSINGSNKGKTDFIAKNLRNAQLGLRGENIVFNHEYEQAKELNLDLSQIEHTSKKDDSAGYDIQSLDKEGNIKYIEVKSTKSKPTTFQINLTVNELAKSRTLDNYFIYIVFEANSKEPKLWKMKYKFSDYLSELNLIPTAYKLQLRSTREDEIR